MTVSELRKKKLMKMFNIYDVNNDGAIDFSDFELVAQNFVSTYQLPPEANQQLLDGYQVHWKGLEQVADFNKDQKVTFEEWVRYWTEASQEEVKMMLSQLSNGFLEMMDFQKKGYVDLDGYSNFVKAFQADDYDLEEAYALMDLNDDGKVTREEAVEIAHEFFFSDEEGIRGNALFGPL